MKLTNIRLRFLLPFTIGVLALASIYISYYANYINITSEEIQYQKTVMKNRLNFIQGMVEQYMQHQQSENIRRLISRFSAEPDLLFFRIIDSEDIISASDSFGETGKNWQDMKFKPNPDEIRKVIESRTSSVIYDGSNRWLDGYASVCAITGLRAEKCGFIFYRVDADFHFKRALASVKKVTSYSAIGTFLSVIMLLLLTKKVITNRLSLLLSEVRRYTSGDRAARAKVEGQDEIATLSQAVNEMFVRIANDELMLKDRESRLKTLFNAVVDAIIVIDSKGNISQANPAAENLFGYSQEELHFNNIRNLMPLMFSDVSNSDLVKYFSDSARKVAGVGHEILAQRKDGFVFPVEFAISEMTISEQRLFTGIIRDISERKNLEESLRSTNDELLKKNRQLNELAITDGLTKLANRRHFDKVLRQEINRAGRNQSYLALVLCDIDYFKRYNDAYGHLAGDRCLQQVAFAFREVFQRTGELAARYGGEEFAVIIPSSDYAHTITVLSSLFENIHNKNIEHKASEVSDRVTICAGFAVYDGATEIPTPEAFVKAADDALYRAKEKGRNAFEGVLLESNIKTQV